MNLKSCLAILVFSALNLVFGISIVNAQTVKSVSLYYDALGQRIAKIDEGGDNTYYISPNLEIVVSKDGVVKTKKNYYFNGKLASVREIISQKAKVSSCTTPTTESCDGRDNDCDGQIDEGLNCVPTHYFTHQDHLGSTILVTGSDGKVVSQQAYYPYGEIKAEAGTLPTERQYTGQISDTDQTGLYYYNARYYNPTIAKFTQADTVPDTLNRYSYTGNNPIINTDPSGHKTWREQMELEIKESNFYYSGDINPEPGTSDNNEQLITTRGKSAKKLYELYRDTPGWWNDYQVGKFSVEDFMKLILSIELSPFSSMAISDMSPSDIEQFTQDLGEASTHWFYSKCEFELGTACSQPTPNAIFNWLGGMSESLNRRWRAVFLDKEGNLTEPKMDVLFKLTSKMEGQNVKLAEFITESINNPPDEAWRMTRGSLLNTPFYWGNRSMYQSTPNEYLWKFGEGESAWYLVTLGQNNKFK